MPAYEYVAALDRKRQSEATHYLNRVRTWEYRQLPNIVRVNNPTRIERARKLGYKAKDGICVFRVRVRRGGRVRICKHKIWYGKPRNIGVVGFRYNR